MNASSRGPEERGQKKQCGQRKEARRQQTEKKSLIFNAEEAACCGEHNETQID
jgi:hypothetical protein